MTNNFEIRYSVDFFEALDLITSYIKYELKNNIAANNLLKKVEDEIEKRQKNPTIYKEYKTKNGYSYYKIFVDNYVIKYTISENKMEIRSITYIKRNDIEN